ncbi:MAG TPA: hypothetical protein VGS98_13125, partial [Thermoanaerobaculia bacterium]|nr:hypothetical protein [Thermoanaerobaculia bacterium]
MTFRNVFVKQFAVSGDHPEEVVEIVRHSPGQPPDRFHLLSLSELDLDAPLVGGVEEEPMDFKDPSVRVSSTDHVDQDVQRTPVRSPHVDLDLIRAPLLGKSRQQLLSLLGSHVQGRDPSARERGHRVEAEHPQGSGIGIGKMPFRIRHDGARQIGFEESTVPFLTVSGLVGSTHRSLGKRNRGSEEQRNRDPARENHKREVAMDSGEDLRPRRDAKAGRHNPSFHGRLRDPVACGPATIDLPTTFHHREVPTGGRVRGREDGAKHVIRGEDGDQEAGEALPVADRNGNLDVRVSRWRWYRRTSDRGLARLQGFPDRFAVRKVGAENPLAARARNHLMHLSGWFHPEGEFQSWEINGPLVVFAECGAIALNEMRKSAREGTRAAAKTLGCCPRLLLAKDSDLALVVPHFRLPEQERCRDSSHRDDEGEQRRAKATGHGRGQPRP